MGVCLFQFGSNGSSPVAAITGQGYHFTLENPFACEEEQRLERYFERITRTYRLYIQYDRI
jgi:hypothetical protein